MKELREHLMRKYGLTDSEYQALVDEAKKQGSAKDLETIAQVEAMQMQNIDQVMGTVFMLMNKINELEAKINA